MKYSKGLNNALQAISEEPRWCLWRKTTAGKKEPINPHTGGGAMSNQPSTWADFDTAYEMREKYPNNGFGFFLGGGYAGIDIDDCIDDNGDISDMAAKIIERMNTYTEISPSKHGVHMLFRVSDGFTREGKYGARNDALGLELYCGGRYLTVTSSLYGAEKPIALRENELLEVYREYFVIPREKDVKKRDVVVSQGQDVLRLTGNESDNELWQYMFNSQNGTSIYALYNGDISSHDNDNSRADLALCAYLAYYTGHDAGRIDRMFRQSGLMRPKWDELRGAETYGAMTIDKAISTTSEVSKPKSEPSAYGKAGMIDWQYNPENYKPQGLGDDWKYNPATFFPSMSEYLENFLYGDLEREKQYRKRKTGYSNIDKYNSLFPGLYIVGSVTGNGKTTFCSQMADNLARAGEHVLYFSLEQTILELATKGISRLTAQEVLKTYGKDALTKYTNTDAVSAIDIRGGRVTPIVKRAIETYNAFTQNLRIVECNFATTVEDIVNRVVVYMEKYGVKPIVFVDYLQIIKPAKEAAKMTKRDFIDDIVQRFKNLSAENGISVFLISSLNRQNYLSVVDFEAFKESGGIEYTADVIWGLQLLCMNATIFNTDRDLQTKRKFVHEAKNASPRKIELAGLKNRYGRSNTRYFFDYYASYDLFIPYEREAEEIDAEMEEEYQKFKARYENEDPKKGAKKKPKDLGR